ncbi:MAG: YaiI/YqxD family protein [Alteromonadaceae bacterium]|nr:YaiI/YqxD family protein [Alteromonadaceae bacterium]
MKIWVDADACPVVIKEILFRAAERTKTPTTFVANHFIQVAKSKYIKFLRVNSGFDVADDEIVKQITKEDLVITADIPLAAEVVEKGALALNPRGELYTESNIKQRLNIRDFMDTLRASGVQTGSAPPISQSDRQDFANNLDKILAKKSKTNGTD